MYYEPNPGLPSQAIHFNPSIGSTATPAETWMEPTQRVEENLEQAVFPKSPLNHPSQGIRAFGYGFPILELLVSRSICAKMPSHSLSDTPALTWRERDREREVERERESAKLE